MSRGLPAAKGCVGRRCLALRARGRCRCAYSTLFAPAGQKRCRVGAPDFGGVAGESRRSGRFANQVRLAGAPGRRKHTLLRPMRPPRPRNHPAGRPAGSARTRPRDQSLGNPFSGNGLRFPAAPSPNAAGGRPLLVGRAFVNTEPKAPAAGTAGSAGPHPLKGFIP